MKKTLLRIGFWTALIALVGALGYVVSALLQILHLVGPVTDAVIAFSTSLMMPVPFLLAMLVLHAMVRDEDKFWSSAAVAFAIIYTTYNTLNYVVQLATVIPAGYSWTFESPAGTPGPLAVLNQTPHSLFWDVDALGYIFLSLSTLFAFPVFEKRGVQLWVRRFFLANALVIPLFCVAYFHPGYSVGQLLFGLPWGITVPGSLLLLALYFRRQLGKPPDAAPPI
jgi:hypothetical protein